MYSKRIYYVKFLLTIVISVYFSSFILSCKNSTKQKVLFQESIPSVDTIIDLATKRGTGYAVNSVYFLDSALANKKLNTKEKMRVYGYHCYMYNYFANKNDSAQLYADSMLMLLQNKDINDYKAEFANAYFANGDVLYRKKQFSEAYTYYYKARQIGNAYLDSCTRKEYSYRVGIILYRQTKFADAKKYFIESFNESFACKSKDFQNYFRKQELLNNTGLCYLKTNALDSATFYFNKALKFIEENEGDYLDRAISNKIAKGVIYGNLGDVYKIQNKFSEAAELYKKSVSINLHKGHDERDAHLSFLKLADLYLAKFKLDSMYTTLQLIRASLDTIDHQRGEVEWNRLMWKYYDAKKDQLNAYKFLVGYIDKKEAFNNSFKSINEIDVNKQLDFFEKQTELQRLQNENQLNQIYLVVATIIGVLIVLIAVLLWYSGNKSKINVTQLQLLNKTIHAQNEQLEVALEKLEESSKEKDRIVKMVAHDLRTPVASIMSLADLIDEEKDELAKKEMLDIIKQACNNSLNLISEILAAARKEISESEKEKTSINSFIKECISLLQIKASEKNQQLVFQPSQQLVNVAINKEKFIRVINNLVTNAVKFSHANTAVTISTVVKPANHTVVIAVKDTGIGIPDKLKDKVFDMLTDAKRFGTNGEQPFGLGLSITKQIVEAHGGKIWFESEVNVGTTFYIELPVVD